MLMTLTLKFLNIGQCRGIMAEKVGLTYNDVRDDGHKYLKHMK
jgi:hypothetical protein